LLEFAENYYNVKEEITKFIFGRLHLFYIDSVTGGKTVRMQILLGRGTGTRNNNLTHCGGTKTMKRRFISMFMALCIVLNVFPAVSVAAGRKLLAVPSKTNFVMDGKPVSVKHAYNINGSNYLQLRAIAELLNGTAAQFNIYWDGKYAVIETGKPYKGTVTQTALRNTENVRKSSTSFKLDGTVITFENAYLIDGDTNYLQLREFAQKLKGTASQFNVYWDTATKQAVIVPGDEYTGEAGVSGYELADRQSLGFTNIKIGQTELQAGIEEKLIGNYVTSNGEWRFYGSYDKFLAVFYVNKKATFLYTNDLSTYIGGGNVYIDSNNNDIRYAASIGTLPACDDATTERLIFEFTNAFRGLYGLPALKWNDKLATAARSHSKDMEKREFFNHTNPDGLSPGDRITAAGYEWQAYAENIFMASWGVDAVYAVDRWVNSSGHRKNMLATFCDELGVGVSGAYGTQNFGKRF